MTVHVHDELKAAFQRLEQTRTWHHRLKEADLPPEAERRILAALLRYLERRDKRLCEFVWGQLQELRAAPELTAEILRDLETADLGRGKRKDHSVTDQYALEAFTLATELRDLRRARAAAEAMNEWLDAKWQTAGRTERRPAGMLTELTRRRPLFSAGVYLVARLHGLEPGTLRERIRKTFGWVSISPLRFTPPASPGAARKVPVVTWGRKSRLGSLGRKS